MVQGAVNKIAACHLTFRGAFPIAWGVSRLDGCSGQCRKVAREESPGSMDMRCRITSGGRKPRESATENKPPNLARKGKER